MTMLPHPVELPVAWVGVDELTIQLANQFLTQLAAPDEVIITVGQAAPPVLLGTPEQQVAQAAAVAFVPVKAMIRVSLTTTRVRELRDVLTKVLEQHDIAVSMNKTEE